MLSSLLAWICGGRDKPSSRPLISDKPVFWSRPPADERPRGEREEPEVSNDRAIRRATAQAAVDRAIAKGKRLVHARNERRETIAPGRGMSWWSTAFATGAPSVSNDAIEEEEEATNAAVSDSAALLRARDLSWWCEEEEEEEEENEAEAEVAEVAQEDHAAAEATREAIDAAVSSAVSLLQARREVNAAHADDDWVEVEPVEEEVL